MRQIDSQLDDADKHVVSLAATDLDIQTFGALESDTAYQLAKDSIVLLKSAFIRMIDFETKKQATELLVACFFMVFENLFFLHL
ncbi:hypothetical protein LJR153_006279 [Paenibacillus sp. LjRoot153]|uniref:hypothetical protein n=1 Tax=Paenibacillus sp. LjRoot153 TaxID=3342270 RepID=UPI003ECDC728